MEQLTQHLDKLPTFLVVAEAKSLSRAAKTLERTRQGVAYSIGVLEKLVGAELFRRSHTGLELTTKGRRFLDLAHSILELVETYDQAASRSEARLTAAGATPGN